jgi:hypothetical protein
MLGDHSTGLVYKLIHQSPGGYEVSYGLKHVDPKSMDTTSFLLVEWHTITPKTPEF